MAKKNIKKKANIFKGESNPFNMKINREKRCILGQNVSGTKGFRGISRGESYAKRKDLWQKTRVLTGKANKFTDRRLMDGSEESSISRLVQERKRKLKKNIFNLNEESLTHKGMPLDLTKPIRDGKGSDSEEEEQLDADFVNKVHFGGPSASKSAEPKTHKEILDQLIVESKRKKFEKQAEKEETNDLTEELDKGWKDFLSVVKGIKTTNANTAAPAKPDPYTVLTNQLKFEKRGTPTDRVKTAEELELEEKERLRKLEEGRLSRMNDDVNQKSKKQTEHVSADSIFDDFDFEPIAEHEGPLEEKKAGDDGSDYYSDEEESDASQDSEVEDVEDDVKVPKRDDVIKLDKNLPVIPSNLEDFEEYVKTGNFTTEKLGKAIENILKPYLRSKSENISKKLAAFFDILVEYALKHLKDNIMISSEVVPHLHTIAEISPLDTAEVFLKYLDQERETYEKSKTETKQSLVHFQSLLILKYCSVLYSVSDYRHPVVTPAIIFMCDILSSVFPATLSNITSRLFVSDTLADCVSQSKRFIPDAITFLNLTLQLALPDQNKTAPKRTKKKLINLVLDDKPGNTEIPDLDLSSLSPKTTLDDSMKLSIIHKAVNLLHKFSALYTHLPSYREIFSETISLCAQLPTILYPDQLKDSIHDLLEKIQSHSSTLKHLVHQNTKPKPLKLFDPLFDSKFDKRENTGKKFKQLKQVAQKIKREEKCIIRDMRRDAQMIAAERLKETLASDAERKRKVKELYHDLATQEGEYKKMMKKKS